MSANQNHNSKIEATKSKAKKKHKISIREEAFPSETEVFRSESGAVKKIKIGVGIQSGKCNKINNFKQAKFGKIIWWNKGNGDFISKKDEIELILEQHEPIVMGVIEANMNPHCHIPSLQIPGYDLERDNLILSQIRTRTAVYISNKIQYKRRQDLEIKDTPAIWLEIKEAKNKSFLLMIGYRQFRCLGRNNKHTITLNNQLKRFEKWCSKWKEAEKEGKPITICGDLNIDRVHGPWTWTPQVERLIK